MSEEMLPDSRLRDREKGEVSILHPVVVKRGRQPRLWPRERQTLELLGKGLSDKDIAAEMKISPNTVKNDYMPRLREQLGAHTRIELILKALSLGLIKVPMFPEGESVIGDFSLAVDDR